jgi:hypothetical protein
MSGKFLQTLLIAGLFILGCSKSELAPKGGSPATNTNYTSGLELANIGDSGIYQFLNDQGNSVEVANNSLNIGGTFDANTYAGTLFKNG